MKIVFLSPAAQLGGAEAVLLGLLPALREVRPDWLLHVIVGEDGPFVQKVQAMNFPCEMLPFPVGVRMFGENRNAAAAGRKSAEPTLALASRAHSWVDSGGQWAGWYAWKLRRRLRQLQPGLVHSNGMKMHLLGALSTPRSVALIWHLHDYLSTRPAMLPLLRRLDKRCRLVIANSESVAMDVRHALPGGPPVHAVYNAVDSDVFTPNGPVMDLDQAVGLLPVALGTVRVGLVATFALWKGHEVFLRAAASLVRAKCSASLRFYVIGGPVYATASSQRTMVELRDLVRQLGISEQIGFTGFVSDAPAAMRALDVVVHASTEPEPFGLVIVQAMACARSVVVAAAGGACELVGPEIDALVHTPCDVDALAAAIARLAADAGLRERLGQAGRAKVQVQFAPARMAEAIAQRYTEAITRNR